MPVPLLILGAAGIAALVGVGSGANAIHKNGQAKEINIEAKSMFDSAKDKAGKARTRSNES